MVKYLVDKEKGLVIAKLKVKNDEQRGIFRKDPDVWAKLLLDDMRHHFGV